jgi:hypothetical protein
MTLFDQFGAGLTPTYERVRDDESELGLEHRQMLDDQWRAAAPYLDQNFKSAFARHTAQRFWELRLTNALLAFGFELEPAAENRPDIATRLPDGRRLWIEATAPTLGAENNPDRPPPLREGRLQAAPVERIMLRLSQGVWDKTQRLRLYRQHGVIAEGDCTVIALSSGAHWPFIEAPEHPRILSVLFPLGDERWIIDCATDQVVRVEHDHRDEVVRSNGRAIAMTAFDTPASADVSGLIYDFSRAQGVRQQDFGRFYTIENPYAVEPLPRDYLALGYAYAVDEEGGERTLVRTEHERPANLVGPLPAEDR